MLEGLLNGLNKKPIGNGLLRKTQGGWPEGNTSAYAANHAWSPKEKEASAIDSLQGSLAEWHTFEHGVKPRFFTKFLEENSVTVAHMFWR